MRKRILLLGSIITNLILILGSRIVVTTVSNPTGESTNSFNLMSPNFTNGSYIPNRYTCMGLNINPELEMSGVPAETQSLALILDDPDAIAVAGYTWVHWLLWNITPSITVIEENSVPKNAIQGLNSWDKTDYGGPCPPKGRDHEYFFKLYALDIELSISSTHVDNLMEAMEGHIINKAVLTGWYSKNGQRSPTTTITSTTTQTTPNVELLTSLTLFTILSLWYKRKKRS